MTKEPTYPFELPKLRYPFDGLEPYMDAKTLEIHFSKHHASYINNLNAAIKDYPELHDMTIEDLLRNIDKVPEKIKLTVRNQGGGHANHQFFWKILSPPDQSPREPHGDLKLMIQASFGSFYVSDS